jgi:hypothetical protein
MNSVMTKFKPSSYGTIAQNILFNYYLGFTYPNPNQNRNTLMWKVLNEMKEEEKISLIDQIKLRLGMHVPMSRFKKAFFTGVLMYEGFDVKMIENNESLSKYYGDSWEQIEASNGYETVLYAKLYHKRFTKIPSALEERRMITGNLVIEDVFVKDSEAVTYENLLDFIQTLEILRWKKS